jgi:hypothetical protein
MRENSEHIQHPSYTDFSLAKSPDDGCNCQFSDPCCGAQFTSRDTVSHPESAHQPCFGHYHCCGWLATAGPVTNVFSLLSKQRTQRLTELTSMAFSPYMLLTSLWITIGPEPSAVINSITTLCLECTSTFAILYCYCGDNTRMEHRWSWYSWRMSLTSG